MKRPAGVTVIAVWNICAAGILAVSEGLLSAQRPRGVYLGLLIVDLLFSLGLSVGLLKLKNWARSLTVLFSWFSLLNAFTRTIESLLAGKGVATVGALLGGIFVIWVLWYLSDPEVIAAFRLRESLSAAEATTAIPKLDNPNGGTTLNEMNPNSITLFGKKIDM